MNPNEIKNQLADLCVQLSEAKDRVQNIHLNDLNNQDSYKKNVDLIEQSKQQLHHIVELYFKDLLGIFIFLRRNYPSKDLQQLMIQQIDSIFNELSTYQKKIEDKNVTQQDYEEYQQGNYLHKTKEFEIEAESLHSVKYEHHTPASMPQVKIQNQVTDSLAVGLNQYASVFWPNEQNDKLQINQNDYYGGTAMYNIDILVDLCHIYRIRKIHEGKMSEGMLDLASLITLPDGNIIVSGGVDHQGGISATTYRIDISTLQVTRKMDMLTKRVGHTLVYVPPLKVNPEGVQGYIYAIGGRTHNKYRTKLCERYNIETGKWEYINKMSDARSRAACSYVHEQHSLYVFFGTDSNQLNVISCERYDLLSGQWNPLNISNYLPGFDVSWGSCISINEDQILLFGGLKDSQYFPNNIIFNRKLLIFNTTNDSITVFDGQLPVDFLPIVSVIHKNAIYSVGRFMSCVQAPPHQSLADGAFVIEIGHTTQVCSFLG